MIWGTCGVLVSSIRQVLCHLWNRFCVICEVVLVSCMIWYLSDRVDAMYEADFVSYETNVMSSTWQIYDLWGRLNLIWRQIWGYIEASIRQFWWYLWRSLLSVRQFGVGKLCFFIDRFALVCVADMNSSVREGLHHHWDWLVRFVNVIFDTDFIICEADFVMWCHQVDYV